MPPKKDAKGGAKDKGAKAAAGGSEDKGWQMIQFRFRRFYCKLHNLVVRQGEERRNRSESSTHSVRKTVKDPRSNGEAEGRSKVS